MSRARKVAVVGGGITGLAAAYRLTVEAGRRGIALECSVIERDSRWGGKVKSVRADDFVFEEGPDAILARKPAAVQLCLELGLGESLVGTSASGAFVRLGNRLHTLPEGLSFLVPTKLSPFVKSSLFTPFGKARMACEYFLPAKVTDDESLGDFVRRRLGTEALERLAEPLLSGIYAGNVDELSVKATFPQLLQMEREHGSMLRAALRAKRDRDGGKSGEESGGPNLPKGVFLSLKGGITTLIEALVARLQGHASVRLLQGVGVEKIERRADGSQPDMRLALSDGRSLDVDAVIVAAPAYAQADVIRHAAPKAAAKLRDIPYASVAGVIFTFDRSAVAHPLNGTGYLIPRMLGEPISACTWASAKWPHVAPKDRVVLRCHFGKAGADACAAWDEERLVAAALDEVRTTLGVTGKPLHHRVYRWPNGMPQYRVGHLDLLEEIEREALSALPNVRLTGAAWRGVGLPDCIRQGDEAARSILDRLTH